MPTSARAAPTPRAPAYSTSRAVPADERGKPQSSAAGAGSADPSVVMSGIINQITAHGSRNTLREP
ncbi:hypothetical protein NPS01_15060 [Nocardioides psychrotolerans]|nr:hypothetical protein NPS01_15060 [Nocardioides psychrotolerans]